MHSSATHIDDLWGHPKGLYICFATELWERFSFYGMKYLLLLYLTKWANDQMCEGPNVRMPKRVNDQMCEWPNVRMTSVRMTKCANDQNLRMTKCANG